MARSIGFTAAILFYLINIACCQFKKPQGFKFGVASASYQIEGGWNADGKGENIWDRYTHTQIDKIKDHSTGDVACDSYHLWEKDVELLEDLGVDFYRYTIWPRNLIRLFGNTLVYDYIDASEANFETNLFTDLVKKNMLTFSLSWSRILPTGFPNKINPDGIAYYNNLIDRLISKGIEPMVTLFHWDLPQPIQDLGGWTNYLTADYFSDFSRVAFSYFGDRVKLWITINEPASICITVYEDDNGAPRITSKGIGSYICGKTILLAHAKAYRLYQSEFKNVQDGKIGFTMDSVWAEPKSTNQSDLDAADREMQMSFGWYAHPIYSETGDYPPVMATRIANLSAQQNFTKSRLPALSIDEIKLIKGSADFLGLNHYHTWLASEESFELNDISFRADKGTKLEKDPSWKDPEIIPWGFTKLIVWVKEQYNNPLVYITENGIGDSTGTLNDTHRVEFLQEYLKAVYVAISTYGCNVSRYTVWSIMDNMEWTDGYTIKFGIYQVNFNDTSRPRTEKQSAVFYKGLIRDSELD